MVAIISSGRGLQSQGLSKSLDKDALAVIRKKDSRKIIDDQKKGIGRDYNGDESSILQRIAEKAGTQEFSEFLSIRDSLKGSDRTHYVLAALNLKGRLSDLNTVVKERLSPYETSGFLRAVHMAGDKESGMLLDLAKRHGSRDSDGSELTFIVSAASNLGVDDMNNFIRAAHNSGSDVGRIYGLAFGMEEKERSMFLSAAANAKNGLKSLLELTEGLGKGLIGKGASEENTIFIGLMGDGGPVSGRLENGEFVEFLKGMPKKDKGQSGSVPGAGLDKESREARLFKYFLDKAKKSKDGVDGFLSLVERFGLDEDKKVFKFLDRLEDGSIPDFTKAAATADDYDLDRMMDMAEGFGGSDRKNFLAAAANADKNLGRLMVMAKSLHGDLLKKFLSVAAKSGENLESFLDAAQKLKNEELSEMLDLMDEMDKEDIPGVFQAIDENSVSLPDLMGVLEKIGPENRKYLLTIIRMKEMDFKALYERYKNMDAKSLSLFLDPEKTNKNTPFKALV